MLSFDVIDANQSRTDPNCLLSELGDTHVCRPESTARTNGKNPSGPEATSFI